jgi:predicted alpha-1,6-mannanase (GH76 family)
VQATPKSPNGSPGGRRSPALAKIDNDRNQLQWAIKIHDWENKSLLDSDGLFWDHIDLNGSVVKVKWSCNAALAIRTAVLHFDETHDIDYLNTVRREASFALSYARLPGGGFADQSGAIL